MTEHTTLTGANSRIRQLERKQRNLQNNFDAMAAGNRARAFQYEAEIKKLRAENEELRNKPPRTVIKDSDVDAAAQGKSDDWLEGYAQGFEAAGGEIAYPPELPTEPGLPFKIMAKDGGTSFAAATPDGAYIASGQLVYASELLAQYRVQDKSGDFS